MSRTIWDGEHQTYCLRNVFKVFFGSGTYKILTQIPVRKRNRLKRPVSDQQMWVIGLKNDAEEITKIYRLMMLERASCQTWQNMGQMVKYQLIKGGLIVIDNVFN